MLYDPNNHQPQPSQLLLDLITARGLIDTEEKWTQGAFYEGDATYCVVGAVGKTIVTDFVEYHESENCDESDILSDRGFYSAKKRSREAVRSRRVVVALYKQLPKEHRFSSHKPDYYGMSEDIQTYNDNEEIEHKDIMALFDRAIQAETVKLRNKELANVI